MFLSLVSFCGFITLQLQSWLVALQTYRCAMFSVMLTQQSADNRQQIFFFGLATERTHEPCVPTLVPSPLWLFPFYNMVLRNLRSLRTLRSWPLISKSLQTLQMRDVKMSVFYGAVCLKVWRGKALDLKNIFEFGFLEYFL